MSRHLLDRSLPISTQAAQIAFENQLVRIEEHWSEQYLNAMVPHTLGYIKYGLARATRAASRARKDALSAHLKTKRQLEEEKLAKQSALIVKKEDTAVSENEGAEDGLEGEEHEDDDEAEEVEEGEEEEEEDIGVEETLAA